MDFNEYHKAAYRTLEGNPFEQWLSLGVIGLAGETGEVCEVVKKHLFHGATLDRAKLVKELGDVLWYLAAIASAENISLQEVAETNIAKLLARFPEGFTGTAAQAKADETINPVTEGLAHPALDVLLPQSCKVCHSLDCKDPYHPHYTLSADVRCPVCGKPARVLDTASVYGRRYHCVNGQCNSFAVLFQPATVKG